MPIRFPDHSEFTPDLSPREVILQGSFGSTYWRGIYSSITKKHYKDVYKKYDSFKNIPKKMMTKSWDNYDTESNKYKVKTWLSLPFWEQMGWIKSHDPYGWFQWYTEFYEGRRIPGYDEWQIQRWKKLKARFNVDNKTPAIRQTLLHWAVSSN